MFNSFYLFMFFISTLCFLQAFGEHTASNPLQRLISTLDCYKNNQVSCENCTYFLDKPEFSNYTRAAHNGSEKAATRFYFFTNSTDKPIPLHDCGGELPNGTVLDPSTRILIIFPGFISGFCHMAVYREIISENFKCHNRSILAVEWTWGNSFDLVTATENMKIVVAQLAIIIRNLKKFGLTPESFACMGHSLGAQACGLLGQIEAIHLIIGSDPSGVVYWEGMSIDERLDPGDAKYVHVTHCNAGQCLFVKEPKPDTYFGVNFTCGTTDVWYNDGKHQWGCYKQIFLSLMKGDIIYALITLYPAACHHLQCLYYYKANLCPKKDCNYVGVECQNPLEEPQCESATISNPVDVTPVSVNPQGRIFLGENSQEERKICGENCEKCIIVGANYNASDHSEGHKNYCTNTTMLCDYCDKKTYCKVKEECCYENDNTSTATTGEPRVCRTQ